jgi:hypothetical protein
MDAKASAILNAELHKMSKGLPHSLAWCVSGMAIGVGAGQESVSLPVVSLGDSFGLSHSMVISRG